MVHQLSILLCCYIFLPQLVQASSLRAFSKPQIKEVAKAKPAKKYKAKIVTKAEAPLASAILIELPSYKSLTRRFSPDEIQTRNQKALALLLEASSQNDPNIAKAYKQSKQSFLELAKLNSQTVLKEQMPPLQQLIFNSHSKEEAINLIHSLLSQLNQDYQKFQAFYTERYTRSHKLLESSQQARLKLTSLVSAEAVLELEALIKGGRL